MAGSDLLSPFAAYFPADCACHADSMTSKLHLLDNSKSEYLLLYYCSAARRRYLPRVTPYHLLGNCIPKADHGIDAKLARQFRETNSSETTPVAYLAAWVSSLVLMQKHFRGHNRACGGGGLLRFTELTPGRSS